MSENSSYKVYVSNVTPPQLRAQRQNQMGALRGSADPNATPEQQFVGFLAQMHGRLPEALMVDYRLYGGPVLLVSGVDEADARKIAEGARGYGFVAEMISDETLEQRSLRHRLWGVALTTLAFLAGALMVWGLVSAPTEDANTTLLLSMVLILLGTAALLIGARQLGQASGVRQMISKKGVYSRRDLVGRATAVG